MKSRQIRREEIRNNVLDNLSIAKEEFYKWESQFKISNNVEFDSFESATFSTASTLKAMEIADKYTDDKISSKIMYNMIFEEHHCQRSIEMELKAQEVKKGLITWSLALAGNLTGLIVSASNREPYTLINVAGSAFSLLELIKKVQDIHRYRNESIISNHRSDSFNHNITEILSDID